MYRLVGIYSVRRRQRQSTHCIRSSLTLSKSMLTLTGASPSYASLWYPAVIVEVDYVLQLERKFSVSFLLFVWEEMFFFFF